MEYLDPELQYRITEDGAYMLGELEKTAEMYKSVDRRLGVIEVAQAKLRKRARSGEITIEQYLEQRRPLDDARHKVFEDLEKRGMELRETVLPRLHESYLQIDPTIKNDAERDKLRAQFRESLNKERPLPPEIQDIIREVRKIRYRASSRRSQGQSTQTPPRKS